MKRSEPAGPPPPFDLDDTRIAPGTRTTVKIPVARFFTGEWMSLPMDVVHGSAAGPAVWLSGAIHGDELEGTEIIRRVLDRLDVQVLRGTVIGIPVVNVFGFTAESRYLPDRRDLNRSFPGREKGSLAARLADLFMTEVVRRCDYGLDYHCGSNDRENLPHVRADLDDPETLELVKAFAAPISVGGKGPDGSLRRAAVATGKRTLVYEGGEAGRFTESSIAAGVAGTLRVLSSLGMIEDAPVAAGPPTITSKKTHWVRAPRSGVARIDVVLGQRVRARQVLGDVAELLGEDPKRFRARTAGLVIGRRVSPLVHQGEALVHIAEPV